MGHNGQMSLKELGKRMLNEMFNNGIGTSKHEDKKAGVAGVGKIYCYSTYEFYCRIWELYVDKMRKDEFKVNGHYPRTIEEAKEYMPHFIENLKNSPGRSSGTKMSAYSIHTYVSAVNKLLGLNIKDYNLPMRTYADITRSRGIKKSDIHFSEEKNSKFVDICRCIGFRKYRELRHLRGNMLRELGEDRYGIEIKGKGGRVRIARIIGTKEQRQMVVDMMKQAGDNLVFDKIPSHADVHSYRRDYAQALYKEVARDVSLLPKDQLYRCRKDSNHVYDRLALSIVSKSLGHNRIDVVAGNYLDRN